MSSMRRSHSPLRQWTKYVTCPWAKPLGRTVIKASTAQSCALRADNSLGRGHTPPEGITQPKTQQDGKRNYAGRNGGGFAFDCLVKYHRDVSGDSYGKRNGAG